MAHMNFLTQVASWIAVLADLFAIGASAIAIWIFATKKKAIAAAFSLLLAWAFQTTLSEIVAKLDRLNEYNASEPSDLAEIRNILHEIAGQFRGNKRLLETAPTMPDRLEKLAASKKLSEPSKRSMVAEVREVMRNLNLSAVDPTVGE